SSSKESAVNSSVSGFMAYVSPNYADRAHRNRAELKANAERILNKASIEKIKTQSHVIDLKTNSAKSKLNIVVHLNKDSQYAAAGSLVFVGMEFEYEKIGKKWLVKSTEVTSINNQPSGWGHIP
ncbi:MAG: hypothetical protein H8E62_00345, partial [Planctomycetes bacterium]|nr:hypothetical protein [Planctomycetota bacterium]